MCGRCRPPIGTGHTGTHEPREVFGERRDDSPLGTPSGYPIFRAVPVIHAKRLVDRDAVRAAVREFPELRSFVDLRREGDWVFTAVVRDRAVVSLHGVRSWPGGG